MKQKERGLLESITKALISLKNKMFYSLLDLLVCPHCRFALTLLIPEEVPQTTAMRMGKALRVGAEGAAVGPVPGKASDTNLARLLAPLAALTDETDRHLKVGVTEGILACTFCQRWYPIRNGIPELLPDHLRRWDEDRIWLEERLEHLSDLVSAEVGEMLLARTSAVESMIEDEGAHYKKSEMSIGQRNLREGFFGPARVAPFNPLRPEFTLDLLLRFGTTVSRLDCGIGATVLDLGVGYGWTSEWLVRLGYKVIGIDIAREYILAGLPRMGGYLPHLIVCDVENLPLQERCVDAVLSFDAFHHFPNRRVVMGELARIMRDGAKMALVEPGKEHEHAPLSIAAMQEHGILERGFDKADLKSYLESTSLGRIVHWSTNAHPHDIYTVQKAGDFVYDSRAPRALVAEMVLDPQEGWVPVGSRPELTVSVVNRGDTVWLNQTEDGIGSVRLGGILYDENRALLEENYARVRLPRNIPPQDGVRLKFSMPGIERPGKYVVEVDMVDEGFLWFKDFAFQPKIWPLTVSGEAESEKKDILSRSGGSGPDLIEPMELLMPAEFLAGSGLMTGGHAAVSPDVLLTSRPGLARWERLLRRSWRVLRWQGPAAFVRAVARYLCKKLS